MTTDPFALAADVDRATARFIATAATLDDAAVAAPSLLPGWTRGHVLTHVARNADAMVNLLTWARTGVETPAYAGPDGRAAGIEAGAYRGAAAQIDDVTSASARFASAVADMPTSAWAAVLDARSGSAARVVWRRLREVEVHHVDLAAGYTTADWSEAFTHRLLHELITDLPKAGSELPAVALHAAELGHPLHLGTGDPTVTVTGPGHALAGWLAGRGDGAALTVDPAGPLPTLSDWM